MDERTRRLPGLLAVAALLVAVGCGGDDGASADDAGRGGRATAAAATGDDRDADDGRAPLTYLSIGDSYAQGDQPDRPSDEGFAYQLPALAAEAGHLLELVNLACGGATTASLAEAPGCPPEARSPGGPVYAETQLDAAIALIEEDPSAIGLVTVSIGGNDVTDCVTEPDPVACVTTAVERIREGLTVSLARLREATGPDVPIVGLTYPDVILGMWVRGSTELAELSIIAFRDLINPMYEEVYASIDATFVDVTAGTGAYTPLEETTVIEPHGEVPVAVAEVCELTWFCELGDIHATTTGYARIAELIVEALPDP